MLALDQLRHLLLSLPYHSFHHHFAHIPQSQALAKLKNLLLLFLFQTFKTWCASWLDLTAAELSWINAHWPNKILPFKHNLCLAMNTLGKCRTICTLGKLLTLCEERFDALNLHLTGLMCLGNRQECKRSLR